MKRIPYLFMSMIMSLSLMAGCASSGGQDPANSTAPAASSASATEASSVAPSTSNEPISMTMLSTTILEVPDGIIEQELLDAYLEANPNISIDVVGVTTADFMAKLTAMITSNDAPDLFSNFNQHLGAQLEMGALEPLNDLLGVDYVDGVTEAIRGEVFVDDKLYICAWGAIPTGFVYRKDLFDAAGLQPPKTFAEVSEVLKVLTTDDQYGLALIASNNFSGYSRFIPVMRNAGAMELKVENGVYSTEINTPGGIAALNAYYQWANVDKITPPGASEIDHQAAINLLATEKAVATFSGPHTIGTVVTQNPSLKGKFAGSPMPTLNAGDTSVCTGTSNGISISSASDNKEAAAAYIKYLTSPENFDKYNAASNRCPPMKFQFTDSVKNNTVTAGFLSMLDNAYPLVVSPYAGDLQSILAGAMNAMAAGAETDAAALAAKCEEEINRILSR